jgi:hypothetical protein
VPSCEVLVARIESEALESMRKIGRLWREDSGMPRATKL